MTALERFWLFPCQTHNQTTSGSVQILHGYDDKDTSWTRRYKNASRCLPVRHTIRQRQGPCIHVMDMTVQGRFSLLPVKHTIRQRQGPCRYAMVTTVQILQGHDGTRMVLAAPCQTYDTEYRTFYSSH